MIIGYTWTCTRFSQFVPASLVHTALGMCVSVRCGIALPRVYSVNRHPMGTVCISHTVLGAGETSENNTGKCPCPSEADILVEELDGIKFLFL